MQFMAPRLIFALAALTLSAAMVSSPARADGDHRARMIERFDANRDGQVDRTEFMAARDERFVAMDGDADGIVTQAEWDAAVAAYRAEHATDADDGKDGDRHARWFGKIDADGDGSVTRAEFEAAAERMFGRFDRNGDGILTEEDRKEG